MIVDLDNKSVTPDAGLAVVGALAESTEGTGSIFHPSRSVLNSVQHWKRRLISQAFPYVLFLADLALITLLYLAAVHFRYEGPALETYSRRLLAILAASSTLPLLVIGGYEYTQNMQRGRFACEHAIASIFALIFAFFIVYSISFYGASNLHSARSTLLLPLVGFPIISIIYRYRLARVKNRLGRGNAICIIGAGGEARDLYRRLQAVGFTQTIFAADDREEQLGAHLVPGDGESPKVRRLGEVSLDSSIESKFVESYIVAKPLPSLPPDFIKRLVIAQFHGNRVYTYESFLSHVLRIIPPSKISLAWAFSDGFRLNRRLTYDRIKRLSDLILAGVGVIVLWPVISAVALAVRLTSPGSIIFKQVRVGEREKPFMLYKFRSMRVGSEKGPKYTQAGDSRFTPIGAFIRKTRLDELPQLWNVLKGDISVIGPRAEWNELVTGYEKKFPFYHFRHAVKPGITGWAQVNHTYGESDLDTVEKLNYDLYYVRHYSFLLDLTICFRTVYMIVFARGR